MIFTPTRMKRKKRTLRTMNGARPLMPLPGKEVKTVSEMPERAKKLAETKGAKIRPSLSFLIR